MIYLISRDTQYSPNSEARDEAIFKAVALALSLQGEPIAAIDENRLPAAFTGADLVLSMARSRTAQTTLAAAEAAGLTIGTAPPPCSATAAPTSTVGSTKPVAVRPFSTT